MFFKTDIENYIQGAETVDDMIGAFERMCSHRNSVVDDFLYIESGNFDFSGENEFYLSLVRQYKDNVFSDNFTQTRLDIIFPEQQISFKNRRKLKLYFTSDQCSGSFRKFFARVRESSLLEYIKSNHLTVRRYEISEDEL